MSRRFLVLGANGMLGNSCMRVLSENGGTAWGTVRSTSASSRFPEHVRERLIAGVEADDLDTVVNAMARSRPDVVVNCIGVVKQLPSSKDPLVSLPLNSLFPHRLARLCALADARLIHISTDCVFSGEKGGYTEADPPDADDLYGVSKHLGEVDYPHAITLRTSIIGHELTGARSLVDWYLSQDDQVQGFTKAVFSGVPTVELARVIRDFVAPRPHLQGLYHVSADPISKYDLLRLIGATYGRQTRVVASDRLNIDRSLDSSRFRSATNWQPAAWADLIQRMYVEFQEISR